MYKTKKHRPMFTNTMAPAPTVGKAETLRLEAEDFRPDIKREAGRTAKIAACLTGHFDRESPFARPTGYVQGEMRHLSSSVI
jgi:hypothetical protein